MTRESVLDGLRRGGTGDDSASEQIIGSKELAPPYERQLELSDLGATHAIVVPEHRLAALLSRLSLEEGQETSLRPLTGSAAAEDAAVLERWMDDYRIVSTFVGDLRTAGGLEPTGRRVVLPVVIESAE